MHFPSLISVYWLPVKSRAEFKMLLTYKVLNCFRSFLILKNSWFLINLNAALGFHVVPRVSRFVFRTQIPCSLLSQGLKLSILIKLLASVGLAWMTWAMTLWAWTVGGTSHESLDSFRHFILYTLHVRVCHYNCSTHCSVWRLIGKHPWINLSLLLSDWFIFIYLFICIPLWLRNRIRDWTNAKIIAVCWVVS